MTDATSHSPDLNLEPRSLEPRNLATLAEDAERSLARAEELTAALRQAPPSSPHEVLAAWNDIFVELGNASGASSLMSEVHPDAAVRAASEDRSRRISSLGTDISLDPELYATLAAVDPAGLDPLETRLLERSLRDFRRSGVDREPEVRERLKAISAEQVEVSQEFSRAIREGTRSIAVMPQELRGLPQDWLEAHPAGEDGRITVTTDYPDIVPVRMYCEVPQTRQAILEASLTVAWPSNDEVLRRLLNLRMEEAQLLGYSDWADYNAQTKMVGSGAASLAFIERISELARPRALADKELLLARYRQDHPNATDITGVDQPFYAERVRRERHDISSEQTREYFDFAAVREGLLKVTGDLFGLTWTPVQAAVWHEDVTGYDVGFEGRRIGRIYLDLHPREGKFKHAAQFGLVTGITGRQLPEGVLVCNFPRELMQHSDVVTLFHEFGHLVHHILGGDTPWSRFSGVATEWDFVEAPSQMLEEWAWDPKVLARFARNSAGESIPAALVERMRQAKDFGKGYDACTQMFYAALSYDVHTRRHDEGDSGGADLTDTVARLQERHSVFPYLPGSHFHCSFGHLAGYSSGYYTYMWSLVIAKDLLSAFNRDNLMDPDVAARYRDTVLRPGGTRDAADLVADFLGRPYSFDAYAHWLEN